MRVYELMDKLAKLPAGAEVKTGIYISGEMDLFADRNERELYAAVNGVELNDLNDVVYLSTSDAEI